jgi:probable rRNA maturation factor
MAQDSINFSITQKTKGELPSLPFALMKKRILGDDYELSLVFASATKLRQLNKAFRNIDKTTDILSFPLSKKSGEIFISLAETKRQAPDFDRDYKNFLGYLFIHGLVHLKGYEHGDAMEKVERKFCRLFKI